MRTKYLDPDFRPKPKTRRFCCVCYRDLRQDRPTRYVLTIEDGMSAVHPDDHDEGVSAGAVFLPIGNDCAARIGTEWTWNTLPC